MRRLNKYVIVDLETTGHSPSNGDRIIEVGIIVYQDHKIIERYATLLNPNTEITPFITNLTGITMHDVQDKPFFKTIAKDIHRLFDNGYFVAHNVPFDLRFLNAEFKRVGMDPICSPILDTVELSRILLPLAPSYKLSHLADYLKFQHDDPHRALSDALVTSDLLGYLLKKLTSLPYETIRQLMKLAPKLKSDLLPILEDAEHAATFKVASTDELEIFRGFALKKNAEEAKSMQAVIPSFGDLMEQLFDSNSGFKKYMSHYEVRTGQYDMALAVYDSYQSAQHTMIEAPTGIGKSLAYLLPSIYQARKQNERIVISTHLTQLQLQIMEKEIPLLRQALPFTFRAVVLKGKQHYLSLEKFEQAMRICNDDNYDITLTKAILLIWLTETSTGDFDELSLPSNGEQFSKTISTEAEGGLDPRSPWFHRSFFFKARMNAQKADIIITNHALLCSNLTSEQPILPSFKKLVIDEAHHLEETASKHFGLRFSYVSVQQLLKKITTLQSTWSHYANSNNTTETYPLLDVTSLDENSLQTTKEELDQLFRSIYQYVKDKQQPKVSRSDIGRYQYVLTNHEEKYWLVITEMVQRLLFAFRSYRHYLQGIIESIEKQQNNLDIGENIKYFCEQVQTTVDQLQAFFLQPLAEDEVRWIEIDANGAQNAVYLYQEPINIATDLQAQLFNKLESTILTSATMTIKGSFDIIKERLGFSNKNVIQHKFESPFAHKEQVKMMVPTDFPPANYQQMGPYIYATCEAIVTLAMLTKGRMLVLFTSYDMLKKAYQLLRESMEDKDYIIIAQGISSGSRSRLKKNFQTFDQAILLGTNSFWEGVDIPGNDLTCVVIARLPFQPPNHPIYQAKAAYYKEKGKNPFSSIALPNAVLRFKQGFGRLIRSSNDRGIVFVCDDRILTARYGQYFIDSIPTVNIYHLTTKELMETAENWL